MQRLEVLHDDDAEDEDEDGAGVDEGKNQETGEGAGSANAASSSGDAGVAPAPAPAAARPRPRPRGTHMRPGGGSLSVADMRQMRRNRVKRKFTAESVPVAAVAAAAIVKPTRRQFTADTAPVPGTANGTVAAAVASADAAVGRAAAKQMSSHRPPKQLPEL